MEITIQIQSEG